MAKLERTRVVDADGRPHDLVWNYDRAELIADGVVHALGITFGIAGAVVLVVLAAFYSHAPEIAAVSIYATGLVALLSVSAAYNLWPISRTKWILRRFDHALIFILIAATYTPFVTRFPEGRVGWLLLGGVWSVALSGVVLKVACPGRFDRISIALCLLLGGSGALAYDTVAVALPPSTLWLIVAGGATYAAGVVFHLWEGLRFQNAVWHSFVLLASALFYSAILDGVVLAGA